MITRFWFFITSRKFACLSALVLLTAALSVTGCGGGSSSAAGDGDEIEVVAYSTPEVAYEEFLEPGFQAIAEGTDVEFSNSFSEWEAQSEALADGQPASVVQAPTASDMEELVAEGLVSKGWDQQPYRGIAQRSLIVIMVRKGNPLGIESFDDLLEKQVDVILPNPLSSDAGRWNVMAMYGSQLRAGRSKAEALARTEHLLKKAVAQPATDRGALDAFLDGQGDALVGYESEARPAERKDGSIEYVIPFSTILTESPIATTNGAPAAAKAFLDYMWSIAGQELWMRKSFRPVMAYVLNPTQYPRPEETITIEAFGGWEKVEREFFDPETGSIAKFERQLGVPADG